MKIKIQTESAPRAIGPYSQGIAINSDPTFKLIFLSGQIPLDPSNMQIISGGFKAQAEQVFKNLDAMCKACGADLQAIVKLTVFLIDLNKFDTLNEIMVEFFKEPFPARSTVQVSALPKGAEVELEAILVVRNQ